VQELENRDFAEIEMRTKVCRNFGHDHKNPVKFSKCKVQNRTNIKANNKPQNNGRKSKSAKKAMTCHACEPSVRIFNGICKTKNNNNIEK
jgi:hypothetical protein